MTYMQLLTQPSYDLLYQEAAYSSLTGYERGVLTNLGAVAQILASSLVVHQKISISSCDDTTRENFWWADKGKGKQTIILSPETWNILKGRDTKQLSGKRLSAVDAFLALNPDTRLSVRLSPSWPWQAHLSKTCSFARAMKSWQVSNQTLSL